jgi:aminoglycoside phosphotransferase (APT) family kinase protein
VTAGPTTDRLAGLVDPERLARWMDARDLPGRGEPLTARFVTGGASNELFDIRRGDARMALRRPPRTVPEGRNESMLREYRVLAALRDTDVPHARVLAACDDPSVLGACFYLMEYVDGWSCMSTSGWPAPFDHDLEARKGLAWELVDAIGKLARVDWKARGLLGFGRPDGFHERQVDRWLAHLEAFRFRDLPGHRGGGRLAARLPAEVVPPRHPPRRLPVRERHVSPRRAGADGGDRRLGDGDRRRPAPRPRLGRDGLAESR